MICPCNVKIQIYQSSIVLRVRRKIYYYYTTLLSIQTNGCRRDTTVSTLGNLAQTVTLPSCDEYVNNYDDSSTPGIKADGKSDGLELLGHSFDFKVFFKHFNGTIVQYKETKNFDYPRKERSD